jgi:hypothetical protein
MLTGADLDYIKAEFVPLEELCAAAGHDPDVIRGDIAARRRPGFPYPGVEYLPANYFELPDAASFPFPDDIESYLDGTYFVCVRQATPANIARKEDLVTEIRARLAELRPLVAELDELERPFSPDYDRTRFGVPPTRDELIAPFRT